MRQPHPPEGWVGLQGLTLVCFMKNSGRRPGNLRRVLQVGGVSLTRSASQVHPWPGVRPGVRYMLRVAAALKDAEETLSQQHWLPECRQLSSERQSQRGSVHRYLLIRSLCV